MQLHKKGKAPDLTGAFLIVLEVQLEHIVMAVWYARERRNCEDDILEMIASAVEMFLEDAGNLSGGLVEGTASKSAKNEVVDMVIVGYIKKELDTIRKSFEIFVVKHMTKILSNLSIGCGTG